MTSSLCVPSRSSRSLSPQCRSTPASPLLASARSTMSDREMRGRSGSLSLTRGLPVCPQLSISQVSCLRKSWKHINTKGLIAVLARVFQRLSSSCPAASRCFSAVTLSPQQGGVKTVGDHARCLLNLLDRFVEGEQVFCALKNLWEKTIFPDDDELREIGAKHAFLSVEYGVTVEDIDRFQEIFVDVFLKLDGIKQSKEASRAWRLLICEMVDIFRDGFETQCRQLRRKHSFNAHTEYFERRASLNPRKASLNYDPRTPAGTRRIEF